MLRSSRVISSLTRAYSIESSVLEYKDRNKEIVKNLAQWYPSLSNVNPKPTIQLSRFIKQYNDLHEDDKSISHVMQGKITSMRFSGKKIGFINLCNDNTALQLIVNFSNLEMTVDEFQEHLKQFKVGDHIQVVGYPGVSQRQKTLSLKVTSSLQMLSPAQVPVPPKLVDQRKRNANKVLDYLVNGTQTIYIRHQVTKRIREWLYKQDFVEVETPLLSAKSNGANAKPFVTNCMALDNDQHLELRIAPELWLKRLCIGGMHKIFEIGKNFRNEGIDATHNPEFTTLEFYQCYADMEQLIKMSESLLRYVCEGIKTPRAKEMLQQLKSNDWKFRRIEFLPTLSKETGIDFSTLDLNNADILKQELLKAEVRIPSKCESPQQILDALCAKYIESQCNTLIPTLIYHHPTVISPLAKTDPQNPQVTKRFEVFINSEEYINAYEEENCPDLQLQKFTKQSEAKKEFKDDETMPVDLPYVQAMRYGMPPIGGFGLGIDRLCMLLTGTPRIEEVLSFGTLDDVNRQ